MNKKEELKEELKVEYDAESGERNDLEEDQNEIEENYRILTDEELTQRKIDFEREALPHMNLLYNYAYKMTGNQLDADDLLQETFLRAFRFFDKFEQGTNCKAWLFRIMKNLFINKYRKNQKEPGKVDYDDIENFFDSIKSDRIDSTDLQEKLFSNLLDDDVLTALNSLQDDFKTVVILCDLEGLSYEEIAEFVQVPIGTVRSRLHRGRKLLQQKLLQYAKSRGYDISKALD
ncbi:MAG: sigma-70 family RNA polymerase sigma factor [Ignavibacteria bacterium]|nr:MAG: sigma-70 family RNA polymerase sigma factor [Chlorobiota bacterium]MBV6399451.1 ECF RNA polymerase sigma factor SigR [Ignavibacteria bacterium]MCC6886705.1 sigma-70 family RNA polymerase sigma factor [Ignavibacteriales bacterium]MCE7953156.1 sigma-70 family RNA polymerase sigma factor [Chlorobi bacterium CHB7]RIK50030.1 MAG: RNA polymerase subunit sigma [Ignavibacteriota bacterium]